MGKKTGVASLTEKLEILSTTPVAIVITSITRASQTVTVTTATAHGFTSSDFVTLSGVTPSAYNGEVQATVTSPTVFTFQVAGSPATPASVPGSVVFTSDAQGGGGSGSWVLATIMAEVLPLSAAEQLALGGIAAVVSYRAHIYYRPDLKATMTVRWLKYRETTPRILEIHGIHDDPSELHRMQFLDLGEVAQ